MSVEMDRSMIRTYYLTYLTSRALSLKIQKTVFRAELLVL